MKNILIICEGNAEEVLVNKILKYKINGISIKDEIELGPQKEVLKFIYNNKNIFIHNLKSEDKLTSYIKIFSKGRLLEKLDKIIFFMDADYTEGGVNGYDRTVDSLRTQSIEICKKKEIEIKWFISPDNSSDGMIEDLCLSSFRHAEIVDYISNKTIPEIKEKNGCNIQNEPKSKLMMVAATQNPLKAFSHHLIGDCFEFFDCEKGHMKALIDFFKQELV